MFTINAAIDYSRAAVIVAPGVTVGRRRLNKAKRLTHYGMMVFWHNDLLPQRFLPGNESKYEHQPRKPKYKARKRRMAAAGVMVSTSDATGKTYRSKIQRGGVVDLVYTGRTERLARAASPIIATPTRAKLQMKVKSAVAHRPYGGRPDMKTEILFTPGEELNQMSDVGARVFEQSIKAITSKVRKRLS